MNDESLELSLANELREIAGIAARIDEFCAAHDFGHVAYAVNLLTNYDRVSRRNATSTRPSKTQRSAGSACSWCTR